MIPLPGYVVAQSPCFPVCHLARVVVGCVVCTQVDPRWQGQNAICTFNNPAAQTVLAQRSIPKCWQSLLWIIIDQKSLWSFLNSTEHCFLSDSMVWRGVFCTSTTSTTYIYISHDTWLCMYPSRKPPLVLVLPIFASFYPFCTWYMCCWTSYLDQWTLVKARMTRSNYIKAHMFELCTVTNMWSLYLYLQHLLPYTYADVLQLKL